jgi:hypothetical protein
MEVSVVLRKWHDEISKRKFRTARRAVNIPRFGFAVGAAAECT